MSTSHLSFNGLWPRNCLESKVYFSLSINVFGLIISKLEKKRISFICLNLIYETYDNIKNLWYTYDTPVWNLQ